MQISLSPEAAAPLKTELAAISTTYLNLSMPSWGQTLPALAAYLPISPQPILGHVFLQLDSRAIPFNVSPHGFQNGAAILKYLCKALLDARLGLDSGC